MNPFEAALRASRQQFPADDHRVSQSQEYMDPGPIHVGFVEIKPEKKGPNPFQFFGGMAVYVEYLRKMRSKGA